MNKAALMVSNAKLLNERGDAAGAERLYRQVLADVPGHPVAARALCEMLIEALRLQEAYSFLSSAAKRRPDDLALQVMLGRCLFTAGQTPAAAGTFEAVLLRDPKSVPARIWLARCRTSSHRGADAIAMLRPILASNPNDPLLHTALGQAYFSMGGREDALSHLRTAATLGPSAGGHSDLGWALYTADQPEEALAEFEAALAQNPRLGAAAAGKASVLTERSATEEARATVQAALDLGVMDTLLLTAYARLSKTSEQRGAARGVLERALAMRNQSPVARSSILLALGGLHDAGGEHDAAFECFRAANALVPPFDVSAVERSTQEMLTVFDRKTLERLPRCGTPDPLPVFIVGMPRSGTSLVEQIMATHPAVHGAGELDDLARLATGIPGLLGLHNAPPYPRCVLSLTQEQVDRLAGLHLARLRALGGSAERVTDKMPLHFVFLGLTDMLFPGARVIHCVRHPLDTCLSCYSTPLSQTHGYRARLRDLAAVYRAYRRIMDHWRGVIRVPMLDVVYEEMVAEPERVTRGLIDFAGLPWDDRCLRFYENRRVVRTASTDQVRRPIYNSSVGRWRHYEKHLGELVEGLKGLY